VLKVRIGEFCLKNLQFERGMRMKKSSIALFVAAALFLVCSFTFLPDGIGEFASGVAVAVVLALVGYFKEKKARKAAAEARLKQEEEARAQAEARRREFEATHGVLSLPVSGVTFDSRQRVLAKLYHESDGIGIDGRLETCEYEGAPAVRVFAEDELIGYIRKSDLPQTLPIVDRVEDVTITIDCFEDNEKIYNAEARVVYTK
jgi:Ca2+/Na+ antiporter